jgi:osmoprotectant transport system ATP-binding protein
LQFHADLTHLPLEAFGRYPSQISGGQRQRVALMRALFLDPVVVLLDEPMGALDPLIRSELQSELRDIFRSLNKTVVMVTHDIGEAGFLGDNIALLNGGRIAQKGSLQQLVEEPADEFVTRFVNAQRSPLESLGHGS